MSMNVTTPGDTNSAGGARPPAVRRGLDSHRIRQDFPILRQEIRGRELVYLDSAATTPKPRPASRRGRPRWLR